MSLNAAAPAAAPAAAIMRNQHKPLGLDTDIDTKYHFQVTANNKSPFIGFSMAFPQGKDNEAQGFGLCHDINFEGSTNGTVLPTDSRKIMVKFPRGGIDLTFTDTDQIDGLRERVGKSGNSIIRVKLHDDAKVTVDGYGLPFANTGHPSHGWLNDNQPMTEGTTLAGFLQQRDFFLVVAFTADDTRKYWDYDRLPPPFSFPYGTVHDWNPARCAAEATEGGPAFARSWAFEDSNSYVAVITQSVVQDALWIANAAAAIFATTLSAYFVPIEKIGANDPIKAARTYFAIVRLPNDLRNKYEHQWRTLTNCEFFKLAFHADDAKLLDAKIVQDTDGHECLSQHPTQHHDLVLFCHRACGSQVSVPVFPHRAAADAAFKGDQNSWQCVSLLFDPQLCEASSKVDATWELREGADPTNDMVCYDVQSGKFQPVLGPDKPFYMALHRDLHHGKGFYETMQSRAKTLSATDELIAATPAADAKLPSLPVVNYLQAINNCEYADALMEEIPEHDRAPMRKYLSRVLLGLGVLTSGPGSGKTTALAVAALTMVLSLGKIYGSAPNNVAVDNFAERLAKIDRSVVERYNRNGASRAHRKLIIRAYKIDDEVTALRALLRDPKLLPNMDRGHWKLPLSLTYWVLVALGSSAVPCLESDDSQGIVDFTAEMNLHNKSFGVLRDVVTGEMAWTDFEGTEAHGALEQVLKTALDYAEILLTTPAMCLQEPFSNWKRRTAKGIVVDEAASMDRPDLHRVWGNSLLPCFLAGDDEQLQPVLFGEGVTDIRGKPINRHSADSSLSALLALKGCGWGVYRMTMQLRMAVGQFDMIWKQLYSDVPLRYGPLCDIDLERHAPGRYLESFACARYPEVAPSPAGTLRPLFINCRGTSSYKEKVTRSIFNPGQNTIALNWLVDLVSKSSVEAKDIIVITPYRQNRDSFEQLRKQQAYQVLSALPAAMTIDSYQGQEAALVVVIMATTKESGAGLAGISTNLTVMFTRHRSGLVVFGDIGACEVKGDEALKEGKGKGKGKAKGKGWLPKIEYTPGGGKFYSTQYMLRVCTQEFIDTKRVGKEVWSKDKGKQVDV